MTAGEAEVHIVNWIQSNPEYSHITYSPKAVLTANDAFILPGLCGSVGPAFRLNGKTYLLVHQHGCESGENVAHVFQISGDAVEQVYSNGALST